MNIADVRADLGAALATTGVNAVTTKAGSVVAPAAILGAYNVDYHTVMGGLEKSTLTIVVSVVVADAADGAIEDLDAYLSDEGDKSLVVALETYVSANWSSLEVKPTDDITVIKVGAVDFIGCQFPVEIFA